MGDLCHAPSDLRFVRYCQFQLLSAEHAVWALPSGDHPRHCEKLKPKPLLLLKNLPELTNCENSITITTQMF